MRLDRGTPKVGEIFVYGQEVVLVRSKGTNDVGYLCFSLTFGMVFLAELQEFKEALSAS